MNQLPDPPLTVTSSESTRCVVCHYLVYPLYGHRCPGPRRTDVAGEKSDSIAGGAK